MKRPVASKHEHKGCRVFFICLSLWSRLMRGILLAPLSGPTPFLAKMSNVVFLYIPLTTSLKMMSYKKKKKMTDEFINICALHLKVQ